MVTIPDDSDPSSMSGGRGAPDRITQGHGSRASCNASGSRASVSMMVDLGADACEPITAPESDEVLADRATGDCEAFAELYRRHVDAVYRFMRYQAPDDEAHDLTAQVFFNAYRASDTFRGDSSYRTWLFRIARNTVVSYRRHRKPIPVGEVPDTPDGADEGAERAEAAETKKAVWDAVAQLSPDDREYIALRFVEEISPREIAKITGKTPGAVRVRIHRLVRKLRGVLEDRGVLG